MSVPGTPISTTPVAGPVPIGSPVKTRVKHVKDSVSFRPLETDDDVIYESGRRSVNVSFDDLPAPETSATDEVEKGSFVGRQADPDLPFPWPELVSQSKMAFAVSVTSMGRMGIYAVDSAFLGHVSQNALAAANFASVIAQWFQTLVCGFSVSLNTLCAQAYGARNHALVWVWFHYSLVAISIPCMVLLPICMLALEPILVASHVTAEITQIAVRFNYVNCLRIFPGTIFQGMRQFLQAQQIVRPALYIAAVAFAMNFGANIFFIHTLDMGYMGSPTASLAVTILQCIGMAIVVSRTESVAQHYEGCSRGQFTKKRVAHYLKLSVGISVQESGARLVMLAMTLMAGPLPVVQQAAHSIASNVWFMLFAAQFGWAIAMDTRMCAAFGAGRAKAARSAILVGAIGIFITAVVSSITVVVGCGYISQLFTSKKNVDLHEIFCDLAPMVGMANVLACFGLAASTIAEGMVLAAGCCVASVLGATVSIPSAYWLSHRGGFGVHGLWIALGLFSLVQGIVCLFFINRKGVRGATVDAVERAEVKLRGVDIGALKKEEDLFQIYDEEIYTSTAVAEADIEMVMHHHSMIGKDEFTERVPDRKKDYDDSGTVPTVVKHAPMTPGIGPIERQFAPVVERGRLERASSIVNRPKQ